MRGSVGDIPTLTGRWIKLDPLRVHGNRDEGIFRGEFGDHPGDGDSTHTANADFAFAHENPRWHLPKVFHCDVFVQCNDPATSVR